MAIDNRTLVRKRIGDDRKTESETFPVDAQTTTLQLRYANVGIFNIYQPSYQAAPLELNTDYSLDSEPGTITLMYTPPEGTIVVNYYYYAFTDTELDDLINTYGINGACVEAIRWLIADSARLHDYSRGATSESLSQIVKNLQTMLKDYNALGSNTDGTPNDMTVMKRTNQWYRGTTDIPSDLSRDDSLSL